ncbi:MAG: BamA/TamA family outer membrane protein, partial [Flavisolibacter sp.]|nr:BamA/TamA family outer membrane protein [Flavisolibacter sp.]
MGSIIEGAMKRHPNPVHVAGHEHSLQMIIKDEMPFIVSGSGINLSRVKENRKGDLLFTEVANHGFVMLEVRNSGKVEARFYNVLSTDITKPIFVHQLDSVKVIPLVVSKDSIPVLLDSVLVAANPKLVAGGLKSLFLGKNYREEWTTPIRVPVLNLGTEQGGLTPEKQGGGKQTRSLRLEDKNGKEWVLRSIRKYPEAAVPADLRSQFAIDVVEDGISASFPYAALSVNPLAEAAGVPKLRRKLVFIPDDPRLGRFRSTFKNTLAMMEEREPLGASKTYNTEELVLRLAKDNDDHVLQTEVLKARILDNFYMDFDRHEDQWRWATKDTGKGKLYYPIPRDQDQAFFTNQGIIPFLVKKPWLVPELQGIDAKADNIKTFNRPARNFDRFFLNELDESIWSAQVDSFLSRMTDKVIENGIRQQPREVQHFRADKLISTLKKRRNYLKKDMLEYYRFISRRVNVVGSNQSELFVIERTPEGLVHVSLDKIENTGKIGTKIYDRVFDPGVTKELLIYGLSGNDSFVVRGGHIPIKIRIIGGPGEDHFLNDHADGRLMIYDVSFENNVFSGTHDQFSKNISSDPKNNQFNRIYYRYNIFHPGLSFAYNVDDGLFLGAKFEFTRHGFRREPYAMKHTLSAGHALRTSSWFFRYLGEITQVFGRNDLVISADAKAPVNVTNFFGYGNNSNFNKDLGIPYYRARYNIINASLLVRRQMQSWMRVHVGPTFQTFMLDEEQNKGRFITDAAINGLDPATVYERKTFGGAEFSLDINSRNNQVIPTRGFLLDAGVKQLFGMNSNSGNLTQLRWDMSIVASFVPQAKFVFASRLGWYHNIGNFDFPQANYLSGPENLRGYRRDRFAGRTMLFNN